MYTLGNMQNTRYLSELKAGDEVLIVNREGKVRKTNVGRTKTEFRPLILIEAEVEGKKIKTVLQNAEPSASSPQRLNTCNAAESRGRSPNPLAAIGGRHFGVSVLEEKVIER